MQQHETDDEPVLYYTEATPASVCIGVRLAHTGAGCVLAGQVSGPYCQHAKTLPAYFRLNPSGSEALQAEAFVPDPCYWTADLPMTYRVDVELRSNGQVVQAWEYDYGVRSLQTQGRSLYLEGRRWVARGVYADRFEPFDAPTWRDVSAVMMATNPADDVCEQASRTGVWLLAKLETPSPNLTTELRRLGALAGGGDDCV